MIDRLISFWRKLVILAASSLIPGIGAYVFARHHTNPEIQPSKSLDIDGLRVPQAVIEIGKVWSGGASVQREFLLENRSGHKIALESVVSDCGCTVAHATLGELQDGKSTTIPVVFLPPTVANDRGGEFRRTVTVVVATIKGTESIPLVLTGFVEPDASLRVFPINVDIEAPYSNTRPTAILHFKGCGSVLASIPDTLLVTPGRNERVLVRTPPAVSAEPIRTKDVEIRLTPNVDFKGDGDWVSAVTFAPDQISDGLTIHVRGPGTQSIVANPPSVILTDDSIGRETTVRFTGKAGGSALPESVQTDLPLNWNFLTESSTGIPVCTLRIGIRELLSVNATGTLRVRVRPSNAPSEMISIPVVILHCDSRGHS